MAEGILRQSYDSTGRKIYPLTVIDGILRSVDVNVMDGHSRGAYAIIDSMKNYDVDFAKADLTKLDVMTRTWDESTRSYSKIVPILSVNDSGFKVYSGKTSTFAGDIKAFASVYNGGEVKFGSFYNDGANFTTTGKLSTKDESNVLSGKIELFSNNNSTTFFSVENDKLVWKSSADKGLSVSSDQLTYSGRYVVIGDENAQTGDLTVVRDVNVGRNLNIKRDASVDGSLNVGGGVTFNGTLYANNDASIHNRLYVFDTGYDGSVMLDVSKNGTKISTDTTITKNLTVNGVITAKDVSTHNLVTVSNELNLAGNITNGDLFFNYRAGSDINQIYMCAGNSTSTSTGNLTKVIAKSLQIGDNNTSYTDSSLLLWTYGQGGSPSIEFRRGSFNDGYTDWTIVSDDGGLKIKYRKTGSDYRNSVCFNEGNLYLYGSVSGNTNRYISSDTSTNIYVSIDNYVPLVVEKNSIRRGTSYPNTDLGTPQYPWKNGYFSGTLSSYNMSATNSITGKNIYAQEIFNGGGLNFQYNNSRLTAKLRLAGWYKIGTAGGYNASSNTNIFFINRGYSPYGSEGYIISFTNKYYSSSEGWKGDDKHGVIITQLNGTFGSEQLIQKAAAVCSEYNTEYYIYYKGSDPHENPTSVYCVGTAVPCAPNRVRSLPTTIGGKTSSSYETYLYEGLMSSREVNVTDYDDMRLKLKYNSVSAFDAYGNGGDLLLLSGSKSDRFEDAEAAIDVSGEYSTVTIKPNLNVYGNVYVNADHNEYMAYIHGETASATEDTYTCQDEAHSIGFNGKLRLTEESYLASRLSVTNRRFVIKRNEHNKYVKGDYGMSSHVSLSADPEQKIEFNKVKDGRYADLLVGSTYYGAATAGVRVQDVYDANSNDNRSQSVCIKPLLAAEKLAITNAYYSEQRKSSCVSPPIGTKFYLLSNTDASKANHVYFDSDDWKSGDFCFLFCENGSANKFVKYNYTIPYGENTFYTGIKGFYLFVCTDQSRYMRVGGSDDSQTWRNVRKMVFIRLSEALL